MPVPVQFHVLAFEGRDAHARAGGVVQAKATVDSLMQVVEADTSEVADNMSSTAALIQQVKERPWITFGSAVLVGYILGSLADGKIV